MAEKELRGQILSLFGAEAIAKDMIIITLWMVAAILFIYIPILEQSVLRAFFALPMILFIPGYALIAALFPSNEDLDGIERFALSFGFSIVIVSLLGFFLNFTIWGIHLEPILIVLSIFVSVMLTIAQYRRFLLPPDKRFFFHYDELLSLIKREFFEPRQTPMGRLLHRIISLAIIAAVITAIFLIVFPLKGEKFTEFYILGPGGKAIDYPERFPLGKEQSLIIGINNHEYRDVTYTIDIILMSMTFDPGTNTPSINTYQSLHSYSITLSHNETFEFPHNFTVDDQRYNRIQFLLFDETLPPAGTPLGERINASYRDLHLWFTVTPI